MQTPDRIIQGMAGDGHFRVIAAQTTTAVETAREILDLAPVAADALGRTMTGALLLARLLDKDVRNQYVTLRFDGDGPLGLVMADATMAGTVRGYVENPVPPDNPVIGPAAYSKDSAEMGAAETDVGECATRQMTPAAIINKLLRFI